MINQCRLVQYSTKQTLYDISKCMDTLIHIKQMLCFQTLSSMFVPKVIATIFVCLFIYLISVTTFHFVNRETFSYLGYYNNMVCYFFFFNTLADFRDEVI